VICRELGVRENANLFGVACAHGFQRMLLSRRTFLVPLRVDAVPLDSTITFLWIVSEILRGRITGNQLTSTWIHARRGCSPSGKSLTAIGNVGEIVQPLVQIRRSQCFDAKFVGRIRNMMTPDVVLDTLILRAPAFVIGPVARKVAWKPSPATGHRCVECDKGVPPPLSGFAERTLGREIGRADHGCHHPQVPVGLVAGSIHGFRLPQDGRIGKHAPRIRLMAGLGSECRTIEPSGDIGCNLTITRSGRNHVDGCVERFAGALEKVALPSISDVKRLRFAPLRVELAPLQLPPETVRLRRRRKTQVLAGGFGSDHHGHPFHPLKVCIVVPTRHDPVIGCPPDKPGRRIPLRPRARHFFFCFAGNRPGHRHPHLLTYRQDNRAQIIYLDTAKEASSSEKATEVSDTPVGETTENTPLPCCQLFHGRSRTW
jgi:hypothetical protein